MTRKLAMIPIVLFLFLSLSACESAEEKAEKHFQSAVSLVDQGDNARALVELRNVFQLDPTHQEARHLNAEIAVFENNIVQAVRDYLRLVEQYPDDLEARKNLAYYGLLLDQWDLAERHGLQAHDEDPDDIRVVQVKLNLDFRAAIQNQEPQLRAEIAQRAEKLLAQNPDMLLLNRIMIDYLGFQERFREGLAYIDSSISFEPDALKYYQVRLAFLNQLGEDEEVLKQLREMVDQFPENQQVRQTLFTYLVRRGDVDAAEDFLRDMSEAEEGEAQLAARSALLQFLRANRGDDAVLSELDQYLASNENTLFYQTLRAGILYDQGNREQAIALLEDGLSGAEAGDQANNTKAVLARMQVGLGNLVAARALVEEILVESPTHIEAIKIKSGFLIENDQSSEAIVLLRSAQEKAPQDAQLLTILSQAYERNGERQLVGETLARAAEVSGNAPAETIRLTRFLISRDQLAAAETALITSLRRTPNNLEILNNLGRLYLRMDKLPEAGQVESTLRNLENDQATTAADSLRLGILQAQNRTEDVVALIEELGEARGDSVSSAVAIARSHISNGDMDRARGVLDEALQQNPDSAELTFAAAIMASLDGDIEKSRNAYREIIEKEPRATNVWMALARSYTASGDLVGAEAIVDEALVQNPENGNLRWAKAGYLERRGDIAGAIEIYEDLYDAQSSSLIAANNLASLLTSYQDSPEVVERAYNIARRLRGIPQPAFQDTFGWIAFLRGDFDEAVENLEPAANGLPNDPLVQYHLARAYEAVERNDDAIAAYTRALDVLADGENPAMADAAKRLSALQSSPDE